MAKRREFSASIPEPDMTPMIDCVFQLLTFFMIAINFENTEADERVKLPLDQLAKPPESKPETEIVLNVGFNRDLTGRKTDPAPILFYSGESIRITDFKPYIEQEKKLLVATKGGEKALNDATIIVRADSEVPTGGVQELIRLCQEAGFSKFALKAQQDEK